MSITDELREYVGNFYLLRYKDVRESLTGIADRIDAEHERAMSRAGQLLADAEKDRDYNYANWQECKQKVLQGNITFDELNARIECLEDELSHCIELPVGADGEDIHFGDVMEWRQPCGSCELRHGIVTGIKTDKIGDEVFHEVTINADRFAVRLMASELRHYHAPTVEDVLTEFGIDWEHESDCEDRAALLKEYAAKLQLAEGED